MKAFSATGYNKVRLAKRATYQWQDISKIIDDVSIGHVSFIDEGRAFVIPLNVWRMGDLLYLHCLKGGRLHGLLPAQEMSCISFAEHDAWVLSKSAYHTSANYRSVVVHGHFSVVNQEDEFNESFKTFLNSIEEGRWDKVRALSAAEIKATSLLRFTIENASAKVRTGPAVEEEEDLKLSVKAGVIPIQRFQGELEDSY